MQVSHAQKAAPEGFAHLPYWRLSGFYFFFFALLGIIVPFWSLYLQSLGFSAREIGIVSAVLMATRIIAPNVWGWLSEVTGQRLRVIRIGAFLSACAFSLMLWRQDFIWVCVVVASFSFFWNAILAQFEVITIQHLGALSHYYSRVRLWGSVGFIVAAVVLGVLFQYQSLAVLPLLILLVLVMIWVSSLLVPGAQEHENAGSSSPSVPFFNKLFSLPVISFLLAAFLLQVSHGAYYTFYSILLEDHGYQRSAIGLLWGLGVVAEVVIFWFMHTLLTVFGPRRLLLVTLLLTGFRWILIGYFADSITVVIVAQLLHAFSFGAAHAVSIELVRRYFHGRLQGQGQALLSAASFGAGGALGAYISGSVWDTDPSLAFGISAVAAFIALVIVWFGLKGPQSEQT